MISDAIRGSADARAAWGRQTSLEDITDAVSHIDAPTLVISGDHDKIQASRPLGASYCPRSLAPLCRCFRTSGTCPRLRPLRRSPGVSIASLRALQCRP